MEVDLRWKKVERNGDESNTGKREKMGKARTSGTVSHCLTLVSCPFFNARKLERDKSRQRRENEKDDRKVAFVRMVVAKKNIITEKRWARRGRLLSLFVYLPL